MAKTRAQRKAERRKREAEQARQAQAERRDDSRAQQRTQVPESADVIEAELAEQGADLDQLRDQAEPGAAPPAPQEAPPEAPAPSRADLGAPAPAEAAEESRRERKRREREEARAKEERRKARERKPVETGERQRGPVLGFIASCWAELKRVQWPDRETLIQASAVTLLFVAVMAAYLGALDAVFNQLIQLII